MQILLALGTFLTGEIAGLTQLVLPVVTLVFLLRAPSRRYFAQRGRQTAY